MLSSSNGRSSRAQFGWLLGLLLLLWWLHWPTRNVKEARARRVAATTKGVWWPVAIMLAAGIAARAHGGTTTTTTLLLLLLWPFIITVTAQEGQVVLVLVLQAHTQHNRPQCISTAAGHNHHPGRWSCLYRQVLLFMKLCVNSESKRAHVSEWME